MTLLNTTAQDIAVWIIIALAFGYIIYSFFFNNKKKKNGCSGCNTSCSMPQNTQKKEIKSHFSSKQK